MCAPVVDSFPPSDSRWARTNQWYCSRSPRLADQHVLGDGVELLDGLSGLAVVLDDADVDEIERAEVRMAVARPIE